MTVYQEKQGRLQQGIRVTSLLGWQKQHKFFEIKGI